MRESVPTYPNRQVPPGNSHGWPHRFALWVAAKVGDHVLALLLAAWVASSFGATWLKAHISGKSLLAVLRSPGPSLWIFLVLSLPTDYVVVAVIGRLRKPRTLHVTPHPMGATCAEARWGDVPALQLRIDGVFRNLSAEPLSLLSCRLPGSELLTAMSGIRIGPSKSARGELFCMVNVPLRWKGSDPYRGSVIFMDDAGEEHRVKCKLRYLKFPIPSTSPQGVKES
jgi:hypothetical protein